MAQVDYFLKLAGIDGESADADHKKEIDVESWSWGGTQSGSFGHGSGGGAGKVSMQDLHFVARMSVASPKLLEYMATGKHIATAVVTCRKAGETPQVFLKLSFDDLLVSSYQTGGSAHGDIVPMDQFSLNYAKLKIEYGAQDAKGKVASLDQKFAYDLQKNVKV